MERTPIAFAMWRTRRPWEAPGDGRNDRWAYHLELAWQHTFIARADSPCFEFLNPVFDANNPDTWRETPYKFKLYVFWHHNIPHRRTSLQCAAILVTETFYQYLGASGTPRPCLLRKEVETFHVDHVIDIENLTVWDWDDVRSGLFYAFPVFERR